MLFQHMEFRIFGRASFGDGRSSRAARQGPRTLGGRRGACDDADQPPHPGAADRLHRGHFPPLRPPHRQGRPSPGGPRVDERWRFAELELVIHLLCVMKDLVLPFPLLPSCCSSIIARVDATRHLFLMTRDYIFFIFFYDAGNMDVPSAAPFSFRLFTTQQSLCLPSSLPTGGLCVFRAHVGGRRSGVYQQRSPQRRFGWLAVSPPVFRIDGRLKKMVRLLRKGGGGHIMCSPSYSRMHERGAFLREAGGSPEGGLKTGDIQAPFRFRKRPS